MAFITLIVILIFLPFTAGILYLCYLLFKAISHNLNSQNRHPDSPAVVTAMQDFAAEHNFIYKPQGNVSEFDTLLSSIEGNSKSVTNLIEGTTLNRSYRLFTFEMTVNNDSLTTTMLPNFQGRYLVHELRFNKALPSIYMDSPQNNFNTIRPLMQDYISLEGNFDQYFKTHIAKGYEVEGLQIMAPNIMSVLIDHLKIFDIEVSTSGSVFLYSTRFLSSITEINEEYSAALKLYTALTTILNTMTFTVAAGYPVKLNPRGWVGSGTTLG